MEIAVVRDHHLSVLRELQVKLEGVHPQVEGVLHRRNGVFGHQARAAAVRLHVDGRLVLAGSQDGKKQE